MRATPHEFILWHNCGERSLTKILLPLDVSGNCFEWVPDDEAGRGPVMSKSAVDRL